MSDREAFLRYIREKPDQLDRVRAAMVPYGRLGGRWWSKTALAQAVEGSPHAMSARMSDLRKEGYIIQRKYEGNGLYLYRVTGKLTPAPARSGVEA